MEDHFHNAVNFIERGIKAQGESKTMAVLIRYISCFLMIYNALMIGIFAFRGAFPFLLLFVFGLAGAVALLPHARTVRGPLRAETAYPGHRHRLCQSPLNL